MDYIIKVTKLTCQKNGVIKKFWLLQEMRRRRNEVTVELRKNKREETLQKRRNVPVIDSTDEDDIEKSLSNTNLEQLVAQADQDDNPALQLMAVQSARKLLSSDRYVSTSKLWAFVLVVRCNDLDSFPSLFR